MNLKECLIKVCIAAIPLFISIFTYNIYASEPDAGAHALLKAYPDHLKKVEGNYIYWRDGSIMPYDDGRIKKDFEKLLNEPDLQDQMFLKYPSGKEIDYNPPKNFDPGRIRYEPFFRKMYGNTKEEVLSSLVTIFWMPKTVNKPILITKVNRVDLKLQKISEELDKLPDGLKEYAKDIITFVWRNIEGTGRLSMHSFGIAVDISPKHSNYWQWTKPDGTGKYVYPVRKPVFSNGVYENKIPFEIVRVFEENGFIWGGRWYHFDTMHFEYRPELLIK